MRSPSGVSVTRAARRSSGSGVLAISPAAWIRSRSLLVPPIVIRRALARSPTRRLRSGACDTKYSDSKNASGSSWCSRMELVSMEVCADDGERPGEHRPLVAAAPGDGELDPGRVLGERAVDRAANRHVLHRG